MVRVLRATQAELDAAVQALRDGELVAFPTETVYGLGAHAGHPVALRRVFELKGRPLSHPLIVHLDSVRYLSRWAREIPPAAEKLAAAFWPGPLTMVLPRAFNVHPLVTGGQDSIGVRVPSHPMAQQLLTAFGGGIAAPSANRYGRLSPTRAEHVREEFGNELRLVLDGGDSKIGLESTIVSCLDGSVRLLRPGSITLDSQLQARGRRGAHRPGGGWAARSGQPARPLRARNSAADCLRGRDRAARQRNVRPRALRIAVLAQRAPLRAHQFVTWINGGIRPDAYAHELYAHLRALDRSACAHILVQAVPDDERWDAVRDRLTRAAAASTAEAASGGRDRRQRGRR